MSNNLYGLSMYIGETKYSPKMPVFFDSNYPAYINKPPTAVVTGTLGSGKTFFGLTIAAQNSLAGKVGVILDPKGDFRKLKALYDKGIINKVSIWDISVHTDERTGKQCVDKDTVGMLDPTCFTPYDVQNAQLTLDVIKDLLGEDLKDEQASIISNLVRDVCKEPAPSMKRLIAKIGRHELSSVRSIATKLELLFSSPTAQILMYDRQTKKKTLNIKDGVTIINMSALTLPTQGKPLNECTSEEKISLVIITLLNRLIRDIMFNMPVSIPKFLMIDEAWSVVSLPSSRNMIKEVLLKGRSLNMACILLTQATSHFDLNDGSDLDAGILMRFAFRSYDTKDNVLTCQKMRIGEYQQWAGMLTELDKGECLMCDAFGRHGIVRIRADKEWTEIFKTTPSMFEKDKK